MVDPFCWEMCAGMLGSEIPAPVILGLDEVSRIGCKVDKLDSNDCTNEGVVVEMDSEAEITVDSEKTLNMVLYDSTEAGLSKVSSGAYELVVEDVGVSESGIGKDVVEVEPSPVTTGPKKDDSTTIELVLSKEVTGLVVLAVSKEVTGLAVLAVSKDTTAVAVLTLEGI